MKKVAMIAVLLVAMMGSYTADATCYLDFISECVCKIFHVGVSDSFTLQACCGTAPYTFSLGSGSLPPGMTLSSSGTISGTPTTAGTYTACIYLQDSAGCHLTQCFEVYVE
jgi:hypothetical protein